MPTVARILDSAAQIAFDPAGLAHLTAADVQNALAELDAALDALDPGGGTAIPGTMQARLSLSSSDPAPASDLSNQTTLYLLPFCGNQIALYGGSGWDYHTLGSAGISITNTGLSAGTNYDVFVFDNAGTLALELVAWTDATTRATALALQDGAEVKAGATSRLWVGTVRTVSDGGIAKFADAEDQRLVLNAYNPLPRPLRLRPGYSNNGSTTSYTVASSTWVELNSGSGSRAAFLANGRQAVLLLMQVTADAPTTAGGGGSVVLGLGLDSTSSPQSITIASVNTRVAATVTLATIPAAGYHSVSMLGTTTTGNTATVYADGGTAGGASVDMTYTSLQCTVMT